MLQTPVHTSEHGPRPPVKWAGGKGQLIPQFEPLFPKEGYGLYIEPFVGGGAVFFHLLLCRAIQIFTDVNGVPGKLSRKSQ
jgi:DNA adenine methylase